MDLVWPNDSQRLVILGHTGSGKSQAGIWHLSRRSWDRWPWYVFNPKRDDLIGSLGMKEHDIYKSPPTKAGIYNIPYIAGADNNAVEGFLMETLQRALYHKRKRLPFTTGFYFDEGYSIPKGSPAFTAIQTQGRSLHLPCITLSQRPRWMDTFVWTEASFIQTFWLTDVNDRRRVAEFAKISMDEKPPLYHSDWWDVSRQARIGLAPVPSEASIRQVFRDRLRTSRTVKWE